MTRPAAASQEEMRRHNLSTLLRLVHLRGRASRSELTNLTGLNRSTVRALTNDLVTARLVRESAPVGQGGAGRPSIVVEPESAQTYAVGLDIGVDHLVAARIGLGGVVLDRREVRQTAEAHSPRSVVTQVHRLVRAMMASAPPEASCVGVGVAVAGLVTAGDGSVRFAPNLGWVDVPFAQMLSDRLGGTVPVTVGNDGDIGAVAEHLRGAATNIDDVVYISGEVGVGGGVIVGGRPLAGAGGYGGEIGHMLVNPRGRPCHCGRNGCWETEIGVSAVLRATGADCRSTIADVLEAYAAGDRRTATGLRRVGTWIGHGVANLVNIFNPKMIVFGGTTRGIFVAVESVVHDIVAEALTAPREQVTLRAAALGPDSAVIGAAELAFQPLLADPLAALSAATYGRTS